MHIACIDGWMKETISPVIASSDDDTPPAKRAFRLEANQRSSDPPLVVDPGEDRSDPDDTDDSTSLTEGETLDYIRDPRLIRDQSPAGRAVGCLSPTLPLAVRMADDACELIHRLIHLDHLFPSATEDGYDLGAGVAQNDERLPPGWTLDSIFWSDGRWEGFPYTDGVEWNPLDGVYTGLIMCHGPDRAPLSERAEFPLSAEVEIHVLDQWWGLKLQITEAHVRAMVAMEKGIEDQFPASKQGGVA